MDRVTKTQRSTWLRFGCSKGMSALGLSEPACSRAQADSLPNGAICWQHKRQCSSLGRQKDDSECAGGE